MGTLQWDAEGGGDAEAEPDVEGEEEVVLDVHVDVDVVGAVLCHYLPRFLLLARTFPRFVNTVYYKYPSKVIYPVHLPLLYFFHLTLFFYYTGDRLIFLDFEKDFLKPSPVYYRFLLLVCSLSVCLHIYSWDKILFRIFHLLVRKSVLVYLV